MSRFKLSLVGFLVLALPCAAWSQEKKPLAEKHDAKALRDALKDVINQGAELFNKQGDHAGCYRMFQGALLSVKPFLAPDMQKEIDDSLATAGALSRYEERAFALRKTLDKIREQALYAQEKAAAKSGADTKKTDDPPLPKAKSTTVTSRATLWERLGGEPAVRKVVHDFAETAAADPQVNVTRDGKFKLDEASVQSLENHLVDFVSKVAGGPLSYTGKNMKDAHKGMGITNSEYDAAVKHLKNALSKNGVKAKESAELVKLVESVRKDIVEGGKKKVDSGVKKIDKNKDDSKDEKPLRKGFPEKKDEDKAKVSGKVTLDGLPVESAYITLVSSDKRRYSTAIKAGSYSFRIPVPVGEYRVAIEHPFGEKTPDPDPLSRYRSETTSAVTFAVSTGPNVMDLNLKK